MFLLGAIGFMHEVFVAGPTEHPFLLAASAALMGLPFIFQGPTDSGGGGSRPSLPRRPRRPSPQWDDDEDPADRVEPPRSRRREDR